MSQNDDPSLGDVIRSVHATGEDRFGVEHGHHPTDSPRERPTPEDEDDNGGDGDGEGAPTEPAS